MATSLWELLNKYKVVIPIMQRDYAQGRNTGKVPLVRENFLNSFCSTIKDKEAYLQLDFIYGYTKSIKMEDEKILEIFYPLDGQQRLTTLFLFHWYIAGKEGHLDKASDVLEKFTYEIRHSSKVFCSELVKYKPENFKESIKESIINQPWFFTAWNNDPTINSMLTMLDGIQKKVEEFQLVNVWERFVSQDSAITFHLLPMDELGLPDDLYIKMNSRGKELTDFEYFKVRLSEVMNPLYSDDFNHKIDGEWYDIFWDLYKNDNVADIAQIVDKGFLRFFRYLTDIIIEKKDLEDARELEELEKFDSIYSLEENVDYIFKVLEGFVKLNKEKPEFFSTVFYIDEKDFDPNKARIFFTNPNINIFKKCAQYYDPNQRNNPFSIGEQLLLYGCIIHILYNTEDYNFRIRKLRNLISNSDDTVRKENMASLLKSVEEVIFNNSLDKDTKFNNTQIKEEEDKAEFLNKYPKMKETLFLLEDHHLLQGCIEVFNLSPKMKRLVSKFKEVFHDGCDYEGISRAMFTFGDYSQRDSWKNYIGNKYPTTWRELFTPSQRRKNFKRTKKFYITYW